MVEEINDPASSSRHGKWMDSARAGTKEFTADLYVFMKKNVERNRRIR